MPCNSPSRANNHLQPFHCSSMSSLGNLERLLIVEPLRLGRDLEAVFRRVQDRLDVLDQTILLFLDLRVLLARLLDQQLDIAELAEVEISLALQALDRLLQSVVL